MKIQFINKNNYLRFIYVINSINHHLTVETDENNRLINLSHKFDTDYIIELIYYISTRYNINLKNVNDNLYIEQLSLSKK